MIQIDFVGGSHGNFLEFVLNKLTLGDLVKDKTPFDSLGTSHNKSLPDADKVFHCDHWFLTPEGCTSDRVISIKFTADDLLPLMSVSLLRTGNRGISPYELDINTYHKLNDQDYKSIIDNLNQHYNNLDSYSQVKADDWPDIACVADYYRLPQWMQDECDQTFEYPLFELSEQYPDCPRNILREFYKLGFNTPSITGMMTALTQLKYQSSQQVFDFPFGCFYNTEQFFAKVRELQEFFNLKFKDIDLTVLHQEFLDKQPFKDHKKDSDVIVQQIIAKRSGNIPRLTIFQEAYINSQIEQAYNIKLPLGNNTFPSTIADYEIYIRH